MQIQKVTTPTDGDDDNDNDEVRRIVIPMYRLCFQQATQNCDSMSKNTENPHFPTWGERIQNIQKLPEHHLNVISYKFQYLHLTYFLKIKKCERLSSVKCTLTDLYHDSKTLPFRSTCVHSQFLVESVMFNLFLVCVFACLFCLLSQSFVDQVLSLVSMFSFFGCSLVGLQWYTYSTIQEWR